MTGILHDSDVESTRFKHCNELRAKPMIIIQLC